MLITNFKLNRKWRHTKNILPYGHEYRILLFTSFRLIPISYSCTLFVFNLEKNCNFGCILHATKIFFESPVSGNQNTWPSFTCLSKKIIKKFDPISQNYLSKIHVISTFFHPFFGSRMHHVHFQNRKSDAILCRI